MSTSTETALDTAIKYGAVFAEVGRPLDGHQRRVDTV